MGSTYSRSFEVDAATFLILPMAFGSTCCRHFCVDALSLPHRHMNGKPILLLVSCIINQPSPSSLAGNDWTWWFLSRLLLLFLLLLPPRLSQPQRRGDNLFLPPTMVTAMPWRGNLTFCFGYWSERRRRRLLPLFFLFLSPIKQQRRRGTILRKVLQVVRDGWSSFLGIFSLRPIVMQSHRRPRQLLETSVVFLFLNGVIVLVVLVTNL